MHRIGIMLLILHTFSSHAQIITWCVTGGRGVWERGVGEGRGRGACERGVGGKGVWKRSRERVWERVVGEGRGSGSGRRSPAS